MKRLKLLGGLVDYLVEIAQFLDNRVFLRQNKQRRIELRGYGSGIFPYNAADSGMGVLQIRPAVAAKIKHPVPVERYIRLTPKGQVGEHHGADSNGAGGAFRVRQIRPAFSDTLPRHLLPLLE